MIRTIVETWWIHITTKSFFFISKNTICVSACIVSDVTFSLGHYEKDTKMINHSGSNDLEVEAQLQKVEMCRKGAVGPCYTARKIPILN